MTAPDPKLTSVNRAAALTLLLVMTLPLLAVPYHAARGDLIPVDPVVGSSDIFSGTSGAAAGPGVAASSGAAAACGAGLAAYIPGLSAILSVFDIEFPVQDNAAVLSVVGTCIQAALGAISSAVTSTNTAITAANTTALTQKIVVADPLATAAIKAAINLTRDMVLRWIITGRFEGPAFSRSFILDSQKSVENAARSVLGRISGLNLCDPFPRPPPAAFFSLDLDLNVACTFPGDYNRFLSGQSGDLVQLWASEQAANDYWNVLVNTLDAKLIAEQRALSSFAAEYQAGQGFLGIRDPDTGRIETPGSYVARLAMASRIEGPIQEGSVAHTTQQAIAEIVDTAIRVSIERGLSAAFE